METQYSNEQIRQYLEMSAHFRDFASIRGLNPTQLELMLYLGVNGVNENSQGQNIGAITDGTHMIDATVSSNLSKLWIDYNLVDKSLDPHNQRERRVKLTPDGERFYQEAKKHE
jgi:DNA-binding MarR family transcriptional regulator